MRYQAMKNIATGLLTGDNVLPANDSVMLGLLELAFHDIATNSMSLRLLTKSKDANILRMATGDYFTRFPELPKDDTDELDIDHELGFVCARLIASYLSKIKGRVHENYARRLISDYNAKVRDVQESINLNKENEPELMYNQEPRL